MTNVLMDCVKQLSNLEYQLQMQRNNNLEELNNKRTQVQVRFDDRSAAMKRLSAQANRLTQFGDFYRNLLFILELWSSARTTRPATDRSEAQRVFGQFWVDNRQKRLTFGINEEETTFVVCAGEQTTQRRPFNPLQLIFTISSNPDAIPKSAQRQVFALHDGLIEDLRAYLKSPENSSKKKGTASVKFTCV